MKPNKTIERVALFVDDNVRKILGTLFRKKKKRIITPPIKRFDLPLQLDIHFLPKSRFHLMEKNELEIFSSLQNNRTSIRNSDLCSLRCCTCGLKIRKIREATRTS